ncbi:acyl carrier protein [Thiospirochaeta perfilievii]|uniref:Acyl carrier protein n=1 Tax=Thiospirochaeta perfilievii TaxID=252967 RepID=A0A5C1QCR4_9SPIO|nr:acyl carrier protein [Thiospirochaeta perfilievii]QEN04484.1 acyl carrier protein [Thiospirochaeta perfilievii]
MNTIKSIEDIIISQKGCLPKNGELITWGEMDSLDFEELLASIEKHFEIVIPDNEFILDNFFSIESLSKMVKRSFLLDLAE